MITIDSGNNYGNQLAIKGKKVNPGIYNISTLVSPTRNTKLCLLYGLWKHTAGRPGTSGLFVLTDPGQCGIIPP